MGWFVASLFFIMWFMAIRQQRVEHMALEKIASYEGFEDGAIMLSSVAREALKWEDYV